MMTTDWSVPDVALGFLAVALFPLVVVVIVAGWLSWQMGR